MAKTGKLLMVVGKSTCGKSYSLKGLRNPDKVAYLNAESGKNLPFRNTFKRYIMSRGSVAEYQADERAEVARLRWRVSGR